MDASSLTHYTLRKDTGKGYYALLIGQYGSYEYRDREKQEESLRELIQLSDTAGIKSHYEIFSRIASPDAGNFLPNSLIEKVSDLISENSLNLLIIDCNLKPGQLKNLEDVLKIRVIGRVELILDIFAMRAKTKTASMQVELAQLMYILPRLKGLGGVLSRLGGGIGTRGPGETMLETDRRHIRKRIQTIKKELEKVSRHFSNTRKNRNIPTFSLVGYTNAGKTTLLNRLSSSAQKLFAEDRLFATLDSFSRKVYLGEKDYRPFYSIITDTIGFIQNLPASLVAAFRSTLDEIQYTDGIIMVLDASSSKLADEMEVVQEELKKLNVDEKFCLIYFNKEDICFAEEKKRLKKEYPDAIWGSALSKKGVAVLRERLYQAAENINIK